MNRLTVDKPTKDMSMVELAHNSCFARDRKAMYRDYDGEHDARFLTIDLLDKLADIPNEFTGDEDFDDFMAELLAEPINTIQGLIAVFYRNLWAMADLHARLKAYEDTGLEPGEIKDYLPMLREWHQNMGALRHVHELVQAEQEGRMVGLNMILDVITAKAERFEKWAHEERAEADRAIDPEEKAEHRLEARLNETAANTLNNLLTDLRYDTVLAERERGSE